MEKKKHEQIAATKLKCFALAIGLLCFLLNGCSGGENNTLSKNEAETEKAFSIIECESGVQTTVNKLPFDKMNWNDAQIGIDSIKIYQEKGEHGYYPYVVIRYDISKLSDDDIYWLLKDETDIMPTFDTSVYYSSEKNKIDFESMSEMKGWYDDKCLSYIFADYYMESRYDFDDIELSVITKIKQEDTYEKDGEEENKSNEYTVRVNDNKTQIKIPVEDISKMSVVEKRYYQEGLEDRMDLYSSLLS